MSTCLTTSQLTTARSVIERTAKYIEELGFTNVNQREYIDLLRTCSSEADLSEYELKKLAEHLGIQWFRRDNSIPLSYKPSIAFEYWGIKYTHPKDPKDFTVFCSKDCVFGIKCVLKHTKHGYQDPTYFTDLIPSLVEINNLYTLRLENAYAGNSLAPHKREQIKCINMFFGKYLPEIEGICPKCFKLLLPNAGFGARYVSHCKKAEIRLSTPKYYSYDSQRVLYVTHRIEENSIDKQILHLAFEGIGYQRRVDKEGHRIESLPIKEKKILVPTLYPGSRPKVLREPAIHTPLSIYQNYLKEICRLPEITNQEFQICLCPR